TSARETAGRVAAGAIARKLLRERYGVEIVAWVAKVHRIVAECDVETVTREQVDATPIRCPDLAVAEQMIKAVEAARKEGNSLGGIVHNDEFYMEGDRVRTRTNNSGGVQGGITNGETVYFRVAFKPTATVMREQRTVNVRHEETTIQGRGRHDPCVLPRAVPIV